MASPGNSNHLREHSTASAGEAAAPMGPADASDYNRHHGGATNTTTTGTNSDPWGNANHSSSVHTVVAAATTSTNTTTTGHENSPTAAETTGGKPAKRKKNRNRKRRLRQQSFMPSADADSEDRDGGAGEAEAEEIFPSESATAPDPDEVANVNSNDLQQQQQQQQQPPPQRPQIQHQTSTASSGNKSLKSRRRRFSFRGLGRDLSSTSLESEALLDHRNQPMMRPRRDSRLGQSLKSSSLTNSTLRPDLVRNHNSARRDSVPDDDEDSGTEVNDQTPLIRAHSGHGSVTAPRYGTDTRSSQQPIGSRRRRLSVQTTSSQRSPRAPRSPMTIPDDRDYDINNPPSMPTSPKGGPDMGYDDAVVTGAEFDFSLTRSVDNRLDAGPRDMILDLESPHRTSNTNNLSTSFSPPRRTSQDANRRRRTVALPVEGDVCFPTTDSHSEMAEDEPRTNRDDERRRRRHRRWPDLSVLEEWMREEKEDRHGDFRSKKISEPMLIEGRLRPQYQAWRREEDEAPYRFTYFNEEFQSTLHAQTISELGYAGGSFRELFVPDCPVLEDSSDDSDSDSDGEGVHHHGANGAFQRANGNTEHGSHISHFDKPGSTKQAGSIISDAISMARANSGEHTPAPSQTQTPPKPKRYGPRPTFWLDVLCPTDAEMRVLAKTFGIHALTAEDIMMQEAREKVELFRNYYFINYRTFEQDPNSENYLEPVNMYVVVFREGVLSFHFSQTPHPANVRRRIRQLMDYLLLSSDWISYALIDDITDVFGPLIQAIEDEVDEIDEVIMRMHSAVDHGTANSSNHKDSSSSNGAETPSLAPGEMLRRVGECRKKVMGMYRLLSNKADVVKGFAKRCNEHWEVAPKSEIGLYLGDIQDHILTMTSSLTYYETLLSRAHSNYLAQINILMNERQEQTADVLGKLTVLGTIVLPLNIIGSLWGMNVKVPGQDIDNLHWFYSITAALLLFAVAAFYIAKRVYNIV